tara:strand:+ start:32 stop:1024 length:993 start_codon:yes stop_codon:yes gene_type:complete
MCSAIVAEGKISGVGFYNYTRSLSEGAEGVDKGSFGFDRIYFTYKNDISDQFSFKFQTDVGRMNLVDEDDGGNVILGTKSNLFTYIKKAQLDWNLSFGKIILGVQGMNVFNVTEKNWGFRFIEKSPMDKHKFSSSADMGIGYSGKFNDLNYSILSTNGSGYKKEENDAFKKTSIQLIYGEKKLVKKDGFNVGLSAAFEPYYSSGSYTKTLMAFFGGYAGNGLRIGGEFDMHTDSNGDKTKQIMAFYGSYKAMDDLETLIYVDMYDPWTDSVDDSDTDDLDEGKDNLTYIIAGVNYYVGEHLIITPNIRFTSFEDESDSETVFKMNFQFKF